MIKTTRLVSVLLLLAFLAPGCGDDEGGSAPDAARSTIDAAQNTVDAAALPSATEFCEGYETTCEYGMPGFTDQKDCVAAYDGYSETQKSCVVYHLGFATASPAAALEHCQHTDGVEPTTCNL